MKPLAWNWPHCYQHLRSGQARERRRHPVRFIVAAGFTFEAAAPVLGHRAHQRAGNAAAACGAAAVDQAPEVSTVPAGPVLCDPWGEVSIYGKT